MRPYRWPGAWAVAALPLAALSACISSSDVAIGVDCPDGFCDGGPTFVPPAEDGGDAEASLPEDVAMCPVTTCSPPRATCPSSKYPCDVDLLHDRANCGSCGHDCGIGLEWSCVGGRCVFGCFMQGTGDCDGDPSNGCESNFAYDPNNCGDCGKKCPAGMVCSDGSCLDPCKATGLPDTCGTACTNLTRDDRNCGACGNACDPTGPGAPPLASDMYYGCGAGLCGRAKCAVADRSDCNADPSDGCETTIHTNEHCSTCGDACAPGKQCAFMKGRWACACEDDSETFCGWACRQTLDDPENCGGCDRVCPGINLPHFAATCKQGACGGGCEDGYADCNELTDDGCEVNVRNDNRHCGACGHACLPDQVCFDGQCLVAPCDPDGTTK